MNFRRLNRDNILVVVLISLVMVSAPSPLGGQNHPTTNLPTRGVRLGYKPELGVFFTFPVDQTLNVGPLSGNLEFGISERQAGGAFQNLLGVVLSSSPKTNLTLAVSYKEGSSAFSWFQEITEVMDNKTHRGYGVDETRGLYLKLVQNGKTNIIFQREEPEVFGTAQSLYLPSTVDLNVSVLAYKQVQRIQVLDSTFTTVMHKDDFKDYGTGNPIFVYDYNSQKGNWIYPGDPNYPYDYKYPDGWTNLVFDSSGQLTSFSSKVNTGDGFLGPYLLGGRPFYSLENQEVSRPFYLGYLFDSEGKARGFAVNFPPMTGVRASYQIDKKGEYISLQRDLPTNRLFPSVSMTLRRADHPSWFGYAKSVLLSCANPEGENILDIDPFSFPGNPLIIFGTTNSYISQTPPPLPPPPPPTPPPAVVHLQGAGRTVFSVSQTSGSLGTFEKIGQTFITTKGGMEILVTPQFDPEIEDGVLFEPILAGAAASQDLFKARWVHGQGLWVSVFQSNSVLFPASSLNLSRGQQTSLAFSWDRFGKNGTSAAPLVVFQNGQKVGTSQEPITPLVIVGGSLETSRGPEISDIFDRYNHNWPLWFNRNGQVPRMKYIRWDLGQNYHLWFSDQDRNYVVKAYEQNPETGEWIYLTGYAMEGLWWVDPTRNWTDNHFIEVHFPYRQEWDRGYDLGSQQEEFPFLSALYNDDYDIPEGFSFEEILVVPKFRGLRVNPEAGKFDVSRVRIFDSPIVDIPDFSQNLPFIDLIEPLTEQMRYPDPKPNNQTDGFPEEYFIGTMWRNLNPETWGYPESEIPVGWNTRGELSLNYNGNSGGNALYLRMRNANPSRFAFSP